MTPVRAACSPAYQVNKHCALSGSGMEAEECPGDPSVRVGIRCAAAKNRCDVLRANIVIEPNFIDGLTINDETLECGIVRLVESRGKMFAIARPIVLGARATPTHC